MSRILIIAGGWSASQIDLKRLPAGIVIGVNDAALYAPHVDICVSMDRLWSENRWNYISKWRILTWLRRSTMTNVNPQALKHVRLFENDHTSTVLANEPERLNGTHSGFCALNLAYQMKPREIILIGFDMARGPHGEQHWYPNYPWAKDSTGTGRLAEWALQFDTAAAQLRKAGIDVLLCGSTSKVAAFVSIDRRQLEQRSACVA